ncbi:3-deoxy-D-manno-octulosonic acid transferase [Kineobactrum sediminis]|uniref:3-deoxy-D-manno-octulosonic acid transferase n=1 Tax=Kineobactrum sediminis TaxID=1905677 RepID=A0A2N5Y5X8_9GAMM|nr:lipid IV(A) 3-deoxy-D-manno-octulosonic acid transferase [Kineobactrum sediminis]PLW83782.1 3-deoxy-D-manno-octulosonic acid transferase [Kineobactrum sediminis]
MLRIVYSLSFRLALPLLLVKLWWSGRKNPGLRADWPQRLGYAPISSEPVIWVHAVSVGETIAAAPLVKALLERHPRSPVLMTAMTMTGTNRARALFGSRVRYAFSPYDTPGSVKRFLNRVRPAALVIMETELWPNMISLAGARGIPIVLVNARLSARSARGYRRINSLVRPLLHNISWIAAQAADDARRFLDIGARPQTVSVTGSIKFDVQISPQLQAAAAELRAQPGFVRPIWIAASTHAGEDQYILAAHRKVLESYPQTLLILVPRHPERFEPVAEEVRARALTCARRSLQESPDGAQVYLADTMGELMLLFGASDIAFIGGSLIERGGHNPLEAAAWGIPIISGPHVFNFATIYDTLAAGHALATVADTGELAQEVLVLLADAGRRAETGANALAVVAANRGALEEVLAGLNQYLPEDSPVAAG